MATALRSVLGLDVGGKRIGVAAATIETGLARPLTTLRHDNDFFVHLDRIIQEENADTLVVGLPRGLDGQATDQTRTVEDFAEKLTGRFGKLPVYFQDEAVTSRQAEAELAARGKPYKREDIDALAATYILDDWLTERRHRETAG